MPEDRFYRSGIPVPGGVFVTDTQEHLLLLEAATGAVRWTVPPAPGTHVQIQGDAADDERVFMVRSREEDDVWFAEARDLRTGEILWRTELLESGSATPAPVVTDRHLLLHVNSFDFASNSWITTSFFLSKDDGRLRQKVFPEELQGPFTYVFLTEGLFAIFARGKVAAYGPR
jgi:hypothetical protein